MPISIDEFENDADLREPTTSEQIVRFLFANDEQAFTRQELADAVDADPNTVGTNLSRLKERGLVRHRPPYWAITDDTERVRGAFRAHRENASLDDLLGEEEFSEWAEHAAADEEIEQARRELDDG